MNLLAFVLVVVAGVIGAVEVFSSAWKSLVGWALVALSVGIIVDLCTTWSHSVHT
jgi:hypothetical protein